MAPFYEEEVKIMSKKRTKYGVLFVAPFVIAFCVFQLYPILYSFYLSLTKQVAANEFELQGLQNYAFIIKDELFWKSVGNTMLIWLGCFIPQIIVALAMAVLLSQYRLRGAGVFRAVFYLPNLVTTASIGILFGVLFDWQAGTVNKVLMASNIIQEPIYWMNNPTFARLITMFIQWWMWFGHSIILLTAGVNAIPMDVIEASIVDGCTGMKRFKNITLPLLKPTLLYVLVTSLIGGMQIFDIPTALTGGTGEPQKSLLTMVMYLYNTAFINRNYSYGATISYGLFVIIMIFSLMFFKVMYPKGDKNEY